MDTLILEAVYEETDDSLDNDSHGRLLPEFRVDVDECDVDSRPWFVLPDPCAGRGSPGCFRPAREPWRRPAAQQLHPHGRGQSPTGFPLRLRRQEGRGPRLPGGGLSAGEPLRPTPGGTRSRVPGKGGG